MSRFASIALLFCVVGYTLAGRCMDRKDITLAGSNKVVNGWKNVGACTCAEAKQEVDIPGMVGGYIPQCEENGKWRRRQGWGGVGSHWCVDEHGHQNSETNFRGSHPDLNC